MNESACLFCRIAAGEVPAQVVMQDEETVAVRDINPQAPTHVLVVPRRHIASVNALEPEHAELVGHILLMAREVAEREGIDRGGYRVVMNTGPDAGQTVDHIHLHVLGGRSFAWPPG